MNQINYGLRLAIALIHSRLVTSKTLTNYISDEKIKQIGLEEAIKILREHLIQNELKKQLD